MPFIANKKAYAVARFGKRYYKNGVFVPEESITDWGHLEYFKYDYQDWTQPKLTSDTSYGTVTASSYRSSSQTPYRALDGVKSGGGDVALGWIIKESSGWWKWELPVKLSISSIKYYNTYASASSSVTGQFFLDEGVTPLTDSFSTSSSSWASYVLPSVNTSPTNVIYFKKTAGNDFSGIGEIEVTAREQISVPGTEDDYDYSVFVPSTQFDSYREGIRYYDPVSSLAERKSVLVTSATSLQQFVVPVGVTSIEVTCIGSAGKAASAAAGNGGRVTCNLKVTPGEVLYLTVGGVPSAYSTPAYNASDIRIGGTEYANRVIVAGGGGSGASANGPGAGGSGGGETGGAGATNKCCGGGQGGTQTAGGAGGVGIAWTTQQTRNGSAGALGLGGGITAHSGAGGAGGAGYYGGGGGCSGYTKSYGTYGGGGGGGSSYADSSRCTNVSHAQGVCSGTGSIKLSYVLNKELVE